MTTLFTPAYRLTIGHRVVDTTVEPKASATTELAVALDIEAWPDAVELTLGQVGGLAPVLADDVTVELGYADNGGFVLVFTGFVSATRAELLARRITASSAARSLARLFVDNTFQGQTAGAIVRDLAGRAAVATAQVDDGVTLPAYVVDSRRSALAHIHHLADLSGFDAYLDPKGRLVFQAFLNGNVIHDVDFAKQILDLQIDRMADHDVDVTAFGESPTGSAGADSWGWLTKDFSASAGHAKDKPPAGPDPVDALSVVIERPVLRTAAAASTAAAARLRSIQRRALTGQVRMPGRPEVALGDAIRLRNVVPAGFDGLYQVRRVVHRVAKLDGFTTTVRFSAIPTQALP